MPTLRTTTAVRNAPLQQMITDAGTNPILELYTGGIPGSITAVSGTKIASIPISGALGTITAPGVLTLGALSSSTVGLAPGGVAGWGRITTSGGIAVAMMDVTLTSSGGYITMPNTNIATDQPITAPGIKQITFPGNT